MIIHYFVTLLVNAAFLWDAVRTWHLLNESHGDPQTAFFLGVDIDDGQLQKAKANVEFAELGNRIHLLKASSLGRTAAQHESSSFWH